MWPSIDQMYQEEMSHRLCLEAELEKVKEDRDELLRIVKNISNRVYADDDGTLRVDNDDVLLDMMTHLNKRTDV